jgi:hypothetical protein
MPKEFIQEDHIKWKDIERCPYTFKDPKWTNWSREDEKRLLLIALDRYADYLLHK